MKERSRTARLLLLLVAVVLACTLIVTGCGGDESDNGTAGADATEAATDAESPATGEKVDVPPITIGFVNVIGSAPSTTTVQNNLQQAAETVGWDVKVIDGQGDPAKMAAGVQSFVTQKVDAIVTISVEESFAHAPLAAAKEAGIPTIQIGGPTKPTDLYTASYEQNDWAMTGFAAKYMVDRLHGKGEIGVFETPVNYAFRSRAGTLDAVLRLYPGIKVVARHTLDLANLGPDTEAAVSTMLKGNPEIDAIWSLADPAFQPALAGVREAGMEDDVFVMGWTAYPPLVKSLREDPAAGASPHAWLEAGAWTTIDQLLNKFARNEEIDPLAQAANPIPVALFSKDNLSSDEEPPPPVDFVQQFTDKWNEQYNLGG